MDFSKLSDAELQAIAGGGGGSNAPALDVSKLSDAELEAMAGPAPAAAADATPTGPLMPEPLLSGILGTPNYKAQDHADKVVGRAVLKGASSGFLGIPALASDAVSNVGYGAKKLAAKAGLAEAPDPRNYYGDNPSGSYFPALSAVNAGADAALDKAGLDRPATPGESAVSAGFEGATSGLGGFLAGKVAQAGRGAAAGLATGGAAPAAASGAVGGVAGEAAAQNMDSELGRQLPDWTPAAVGMLSGAAAGGALSRAAGRAANARAGAAPTVDELQGAKRDAYARADASGVEVHNDSFRQLHDNVRRDLDAAGIFQDIKPGPQVANVLEPFENSVASGAPVPIGRVERIRQNAGRLARDQDPQVAHAGQVIRGRLDSFLNRDATPADFIEPRPGAAAQALADTREARVLANRARKAGFLDDHLESADLRSSSSGSGANGQNAERQDIRKLVDPTSQKAARVAFSPEETRQAQAIVRGGRLENALRKVGKFAPDGPVSAMGFLQTTGALGGGGYALGGSTGALGGFAAGAGAYGAKAASSAIQRGKVNRLSDTIRRGYALPEVSGAGGAFQGMAGGFLANDDRKPRRSRYR